MEVFASPYLREIERPVEVIFHCADRFGAVQEQVAKPVRPAPLGRFMVRGVDCGVDHVAQLRVLREITVDPAHSQVAVVLRPDAFFEMYLPAYGRFAAEHPAGHAFRDNSLLRIGEAIFISFDKRESEYIHDSGMAGRHFLAKTFCVAFLSGRKVV